MSIVLYINANKYTVAEKRAELYNAGSVFLNELMDDVDGEISIIVSVKGSGLEEGVDGYCLCTEEHDDGKPKEFQVDIRGDMGLEHAIKCMAHEFVHVWQMCTGRIDENVYHNTKDYYNSPWEVEARELEQPLYELYVNCV